MNETQNVAPHNVKSRIVSYRISQDEWQRAASVAALADQNVSDFARAQLLESSAHSCGLSPGLQLVMAEVQAMRQLVGILVDFLVTDADFNHNAYLAALDDNEDARQTRLREYFARAEDHEIHSDQLIRSEIHPSSDKMPSTEPLIEVDSPGENPTVAAGQLNLY